MPIRRSAAAPPKEDAPPANAPEGADAKAEGSAPAGDKKKDKDPAPAEPAATEGEESAADKGEEPSPPATDGEEQAKNNGETPNEGEKSEEAGTDKGKNKKKKSGGKETVAKVEKEVDDKVKKVKRKIPAWATISGSKLATTSFSQPKVEEILLEAIESSKERGGASAITIMKYVMKKYPSVEMDKKTKNLYKRALKRLVDKGAVKQLKGKGFSGSFTIGKKPAVMPGAKGTLGETLPLIMTRLCEPKEASYILIKKYLEQHFPQLNVENRPDVLKNCLQRSVEKGYLEQITGKGASGTFQLKRAGNKVLMSGGLLEDAIVAAITAMNEPKTCSISILRKFLVEKQKEQSVYFVVSNLKRTLQKCKMMGWMEQISGHGLSGSYQLCYPYYPSPAVLFPEMMEKIKQMEERRVQRKRKNEESSNEESEEESEEEESEEDEPPKKRRQKVKRAPAPKARQSKKAKTPSRKPPPAKRSVAPPKKAAPPAKKPAAASKKEPEPVKATPVKKAAPTRKPKTPIAKKMTSRVSKRPPAKKEVVKKESAVKTKPAARKSLRAKK